MPEKENPCFMCMVLGHRGHDHDLPPSWPERLRQRWTRNRDLWAVTRAAMAAGFKAEQIARLFEVDMAAWEDIARLVALTESAALRDVGVQRWECGTAPLTPPPTNVRRGPPRAKFVAGVDVDANDAYESEDLDEHDDMEEDEPAAKCPKVQGSPGPGSRKRPPVTPSKKRGEGGGVAPAELGEGTPLVLVSQFQAAEARVDGLENKLAQEVDTLREDIGSVKEDVGAVRAMSAVFFDKKNCPTRRSQGSPAPALPAPGGPDPSKLPLPPSGPPSLLETGGG